MFDMKMQTHTGARSALVVFRFILQFEHWNFTFFLMMLLLLFDVIDNEYQQKTTDRLE